VTGSYAPSRAGDLAGAVLVGGADADMMPASDHVTRWPGSVGDDLSDRLYPTRSPTRARDRRPRTDRRCRSAGAVPGTSPL